MLSNNDYRFMPPLLLTTLHFTVLTNNIFFLLALLPLTFLLIFFSISIKLHTWYVDPLPVKCTFVFTKSTFIWVQRHFTICILIFPLQAMNHYKILHYISLYFVITYYITIYTYNSTISLFFLSTALIQVLPQINLQAPATYLQHRFTLIL
jgi:hypothetical protein